MITRNSVSEIFNRCNSPKVEEYGNRHENRYQRDAISGDVNEINLLPQLKMKRKYGARVTKKPFAEHGKFNFHLVVFLVYAGRVIRPRSICFRMSKPFGVALTSLVCKSCHWKVLEDKFRQIQLWSRACLLEVSNSKMGGQGTLAIVLMGVSGKQLQLSNCPVQYVPVIGK